MFLVDFSTVTGKTTHKIWKDSLQDAILRPLLPDSRSPHPCSAQEYTPSQAQSIGANLPLWVSATGWIRKSQSLKLVLDTLWKKTSSNNIHLPHLERDHTQAQLPPTLDINSRAIHLCMTTTFNQKYRLRLLKQAQQWWQGLTVLIFGIA